MFLSAWTVAGVLGLTAAMAGLHDTFGKSREVAPLLSSVTMVPGVLFLALAHGLFQASPDLLAMFVLLPLFFASLLGIPVFAFILVCVTWTYVRERRWGRVWIPFAHALFLSMTAYKAFLLLGTS